MAEVRRSGSTGSQHAGDPRGAGPSASLSDTASLNDTVRAIAHDLRQPAAAISALVAAARVNPELPESVRSQLDCIAKQAKEISRLCRLFVEQTSVRRLRLDHVVADAVERSRLVFATGVDLVVTPVTVVADETAWVRLTGNLLENACRAAGPKGEVAVRLYVAPGGVTLDVADSGPGFGHGETGLSGAGLGVVFRAIERDGGHVEIGRSALGGALVRVVVPDARLELDDGK